MGKEPLFAHRELPSPLLPAFHPDYELIESTHQHLSRDQELELTQRPGAAAEPLDTTEHRFWVRMMMNELPVQSFSAEPCLDAENYPVHRKFSEMKNLLIGGSASGAQYERLNCGRRAFAALLAKLQPDETGDQHGGEHRRRPQPAASSGGA